MKILIFEYITGGGFCADDLPDSLAREGSLMLNALLDDFATLLEHEVIVMLDSRLMLEYGNSKIITVKPNDDVLTVFDKALHDCDAAWIIAPETDNILFNFTRRVEQANKLLLSSPSSAIAKSANKLQTFYLLALHKILTVYTDRLIDYLDIYNMTGLRMLEKMLRFPLVIKSIDGVGCENIFFIKDLAELYQALQQITPLQNYIIQPFVSGDTLSVSAIFKHGQAQLICVNRQHLEVKNQRFKLLACEVNIAVDKTQFQNLLNKIAKAFPDLFGYAGVDLIRSDLLYVVEINPRLTSSYSGIKQALGINVADFVLQSIAGEAVINPTSNQTISISIARSKKTCSLL